VDFFSVQLCRIAFDHRLVVTNGHEVYPLDSIHAHGCSLSEGICFLSAYNIANTPSTMCIRTLLRDSTQLQIHNACPLTCQNTQHDFPVVTAIASHSRNLYALTNIANTSRIACFDSNNTQISEEMIHRRPRDEPLPGTIIVRLACNCRIRIPGTSTIFSVWPWWTEKNASLTKITLSIPLRWTHFI